MQGPGMVAMALGVEISHQGFVASEKSTLRFSREVSARFWEFVRLVSSRVPPYDTLVLKSGFQAVLSSQCDAEAILNHADRPQLQFVLRVQNG